MIDMKDEAAKMGFEAALAHAPKLNAKELFELTRINRFPVVPERHLAALRQRFGDRADNLKSKPRRAFDRAWRVTLGRVGLALDGWTSPPGNVRVCRVMVEEARKHLPQAIRELRREFA